MEGEEKGPRQMPRQVGKVMNCVGAQSSSTAKDDEFIPEAEEGRSLELMCNNSPLLGPGKSTLKWFVLFESPAIKGSVRY